MAAASTTRTTPARKPAAKRPPVADHKPKAGEVQKALANGDGVTIPLHDREWTISADALDDFELLEDLNALESGNTARAGSVLSRILGPEQYDEAKAALRGDDGRLRASVMIEFLGELLSAANPN